MDAVRYVIVWVIGRTLQLLMWIAERREDEDYEV